MWSLEKNDFTLFLHAYGYDVPNRFVTFEVHVSRRVLVIAINGKDDYENFTE